LFEKHSSSSRKDLEYFNILFPMNKLYSFIQRLEVHVEIMPIKITIYSTNPNETDNAINIFLPHITLKSSNTKLTLLNLRNSISESNKETGTF
jgi:hypothetical protein